MRERRRVVDEEVKIVHVAVPPVLTGFVGLDDRMMLCGEVGGGVAVRRVVATADVTARHAHAEVHPAAADAQAVLAPLAARRDIGDLVEVTAVFAHRCSCRGRRLAAVSLMRTSGHYKTGPGWGTGPMSFARRLRPTVDGECRG